MFLGLIGFGFFYWYFDQAGARVEYRNVNSMLEILISFSFLIVGLYFGLYFYSGKKLANQIGGGSLLFLVIAYILGFLLH